MIFKLLFLSVLHFVIRRSCMADTINLLICFNKHEWLYEDSFLLSSTISRVLYQTIIFLDCTLPHSSSARFPWQNATNPEARRAAVSLPIRSCFGWSLHSLVCYQPSGGLLPRHSTITCRKAAGCFFSIALVLESPPPDVIRHPALWSPDFPPFQAIVCAAHAVF